jgi:hypothetical protein
LRSLQPNSQKIHWIRDLRLFWYVTIDKNGRENNSTVKRNSPPYFDFPKKVPLAGGTRGHAATSGCAGRSRWSPEQALVVVKR